MNGIIMNDKVHATDKTNLEIKVSKETFTQMIQDGTLIEGATYKVTGYEDDIVISSKQVGYDNTTVEQELNILRNTIRRSRRNITNDLANLTKAVAEQNLEKYGYTIGDYFIGPSGYQYNLADMDPYYGGYNSYSVVGTHHCGIVVDTGQTSPWLSSDTVTSYNKSTLHNFLTTIALNVIRNDFTSLFGSADHLVSYQMLDNAIGGWGDTWATNTVISALSEVQVYGGPVWSADAYQTGSACKKLSIFDKYKFNEIIYNDWFWLKSLSSSSRACAAGSEGCAYTRSVDLAGRVVGLILFY